MAKIEPTNQDILEGMNKRFNMVFQELLKHDERFGMMSKQMGSLVQGQGELKEYLQKHTKTLEEIQGTLGAFGKAIDRDAVSIVRYGRRISRLEKAFK